jgi:hypothetical protein
MPQIIVRYNPKLISPDMLKHLDSVFSPVVANLASVASGPIFTAKDVDFFTYANETSSRCPDLAIEIRTIGHADRIESLNQSAQILVDIVVKALIVKCGLNIPPHGFLWIQAISPAGVHV